MSVGAIVILAVLAWPAPASRPRPAIAVATMTTPIAAVATSASFARTARQPLTGPVRRWSALRLDAATRSHDPLQFAGLRALRFDRGRYRPSPIDAKLELRMTGDSTSLGLGGAVSRLLRHVAR